MLFFYSLDQREFSYPLTQRYPYRGVIAYGS